MRKTAIVLAGGRGTRMNSDTPKQFLPIKGKPIINYSLDAFEDSFVVDDILIAAASSDRDYIENNILTRRNYRKVIGICESGSERYESVKNALEFLDEHGYDGNTCVYIHDSARPYLTQDLLIKLFSSFGKYGNAVPAVKVKDTIKVVKDGVITDSPDRAMLMAAQTPQVFRLGEILSGYRKMYEADDFDLVTDDAFVADKFAGIACHIVEGDYSNIKITTREDLKQ